MCRCAGIQKDAGSFDNPKILSVVTHTRKELRKVPIAKQSKNKQQALN